MGKSLGTRNEATSRPVHNRNARLPAELLQQSLMDASCSLVITDCRQRGNPVVFVNQAYEKTTGYKAGEVLGKSCRFLLGMDWEQESLNEIRNALKRGRPCIAVVRSSRKDGSLFHNELSIAPIHNNSNQKTHFMWVQKDITAQVEKEEGMAALIAEKERRFAAYMENASEAIWRIDFEPPIPLGAPQSRQVQGIFDNGVFSEANDAVALTYGLTKGKEVIGRPLREFMVQSDPKNIERMVEFVQQKFRVNNFLTYEKISDRITKTIVNNITPGIQDGQVRHIWGASLDLSEFFEAKEDLGKSRKEIAVQKRALVEKSAALKELIAHIELDKKRLKDRMLANVEQVVMPSLEKVRLNNGAEVHIEQLRMALKDLTSSFGLKVTDSRIKLTHRETEVCNMVKNGLTSKEIAHALNIALHTVEKHRRMARNKLDLANKGINLRTYLNSV